MSLNDLSKLSDMLSNDELSGDKAHGLSFDAYPLDKWQPEHCGLMNLIIKENGDWWHEGSEIKRQKLILLFSKVLCKENKSYYLKTPVEKIEIVVEDAPYLVTSHRVVKDDNGAIAIYLVTNIGDEVPLSQVFPIELRGEEARPYLLLKRGLDALISRSVFYDLVDIALSQGGEVENELWLTTHSHKFCLGSLS